MRDTSTLDFRSPEPGENKSLLLKPPSLDALLQPSPDTHTDGLSCRLASLHLCSCDPSRHQPGPSPTTQNVSPLPRDFCSPIGFPSIAHNDQREKFDLSQSLVSLWCQASPAATGIEGGGGAGPTLYPLVEGSSTGGLKLGDTGHDAEKAPPNRSPVDLNSSPLPAPPSRLPPPAPEVGLPRADHAPRHRPAVTSSGETMTSQKRGGAVSGRPATRRHGNGKAGQGRRREPRLPEGWMGPGSFPAPVRALAAARLQWSRGLRPGRAGAAAKRGGRRAAPPAAAKRRARRRAPPRAVTSRARPKAAGRCAVGAGPSPATLAA
ncbi:hypothetical protein J1605_022481 [Eschrichtius robustus]|uniref:Uncharacterized protein n=1 Tax=Eschrichtius robustus TaxID=9764 RepID=A0AB34H8Z9_ESCRO|nr:hypothetical protein J1605_022481 [Eschrichtius robustus]